MRITDIIDKKRLGFELSEHEINWIIEAYVKGDIEDYHMSAFAMAVCFVGMTDRETANLTYAMAESGDTIDLSAFGNLSVDKHSTGGVGDKTSLIIAPIVASLGAKVAKMSGRGLGHTGGTIDKLESIPGYRTSLSNDEFLQQINNIGISIISANKNLAPADKKLYALRDVTATVESIPLIASSIMSKKIASGAKNIVIDVKCGSGAFMKTQEDATLLAERIVAIGKHCDRNITAIITDMDKPLGCAIGNALEVKEVINVLQGKGPEDLTEISIVLASEMLSLVFGGNWENTVKDSISSGTAFTTFNKWIKSQGGDINNLPTPEFSLDITSDFDGYIAHMDSKMIGLAAMELGAGRNKVTDIIDPSAGIVLVKKTGDYLKKGDKIATLYSSTRDKLLSAQSIFNSALRISKESVDEIPIVLKIIK